MFFYVYKLNFADFRRLQFPLPDSHFKALQPYSLINVLYADIIKCSVMFHVDLVNISCGERRIERAKERLSV